MRRAKWSASIVRSCAKCFSLLCLHATRLDFSRLASCQHSVKQCLCFGERELSQRFGYRHHTEACRDFQPPTSASERRIEPTESSAAVTRQARVEERDSSVHELYTNIRDTSYSLHALEAACALGKHSLVPPASSAQPRDTTQGARERLRDSRQKERLSQQVRHSSLSLAYPQRRHRHRHRRKGRILAIDDIIHPRGSSNLQAEAAEAVPAGCSWQALGPSFAQSLPDKLISFLLPPSSNARQQRA